MPKIIDSVDRSIRAIDAARIAQPDVRPQVLALLRTAGFKRKDANGALAFLEIALSSYKARLSNPEQYPRLSEQRAELETLIKKAKPLLLSCQRLSQASRLKILDAHKPALVVPEADPFRMQTELRGLIRRASMVLHELAEDAGGQLRDVDLERLLFQIAILWHRVLRTGKGVRCSQDKFRGPLVDFAFRIFGLEGVEIGSKAEAAKRLYDIQRAAAVRADEEREKARAYAEAIKNDD